MKEKDSSYDPSYSAYVERMADELRKLPKRPVSTVQCASTQAVLDRPVEQDLDHWLRPIASNWRANEFPINLSDRKAMALVVGERPISPEEYHVDRIMRDSGSMGSFGKEATEGTGVTPEVREKAVHAFTYSQPADLTPAQIQQAKDNEMTAIKLHTPTMEDVNALLGDNGYKPKTWDSVRTWWDKLWGKMSMKNIRDKK